MPNNIGHKFNNLSIKYLEDHKIPIVRTIDVNKAKTEFESKKGNIFFAIKLHGARKNQCRKIIKRVFREILSIIRRELNLLAKRIERANIQKVPEIPAAKFKRQFLPKLGPIICAAPFKYRTSPTMRANTKAIL